VFFWYWSVDSILPDTFRDLTLISICADTEIWCHEDELKHAFWSYATGFGRGPYVKDYLDVEKLNWKIFSGQMFELYQGVTLHHIPGHTIGGVAMELDLARTGCVVITGDAFHIGENYDQGIHPGILTTDLNAWYRSRTYIRALVQRKQGKVVLTVVIRETTVLSLCQLPMSFIANVQKSCLMIAFVHHH
jgi:glyoxylase-like metal-dependent hydrolase (beta-lactamase superfamily II)